MPEVIEDLFDKFDKGDVRTTEKIVDLSTIDTSSGEILVTLEDLVSVEDPVAVLVNEGTADSPEYQPVDNNAGSGAVAAAKVYNMTNPLSAGELEDNEVGVLLFDNALAAIDTDEGGRIKVIARGY